MFKQNRVSTILVAALMLASTVLAAPASARTQYRDRGREIRVDRDNDNRGVIRFPNNGINRDRGDNRRLERAVRLPNGDLRLPNGDIIRNDRRDRRAVRLPNGDLRLPNGEIVRVDR